MSKTERFNIIYMKYRRILPMMLAYRLATLTL